jgi:hypothetical protein
MPVYGLFAYGYFCAFSIYQLPLSFGHFGLLFYGDVCCKNESLTGDKGK